ncbi:MAG TPA: c-type cytochrome [Candidatus Limnocylindria bacterium]|nr:c-type cytochrome [Candidatus Limnocylindria bacterium]
MTVHTPIESRSSGVPGWALLLTALVLLIGGVYLVANLQGENPPLAIPGESAPAAAPSGADAGAALVQRANPQCTACHGADLGGQATFPSLHDIENGPVSENLQELAAEYPDNWAQLWIAGAPETEGIDRMGMPEFGDQFSEEELDLIVEYLESLP